MLSCVWLFGTPWTIQWCESRSVVSDSLQPHGLYSPWNSPGQNTRMGRLSFLQGVFPTQGLNPGLPHCRWIIYQLSYKGSPRVLEWVAYPFSSGSSRPRNRTGVSCIAGRFFTNWTIRKAQKEVGFMILISYEIKFWKTVTKMTLHKLSNIQWSSYRQLCPTHMYNLTKMVGNYRWGWGCGSNDRKIWRPLIAFYGLLSSN